SGARARGTPISTVKKSAGGKTARITYREGGADYTAPGASKPVAVKEDGLWDAESLDARLAGIVWSKGKLVRFKIIDVDSDDGAVYPMIAEGLGEEQCGERRCTAVKLTLDGWRRPFGPTVLFRYGVGGSAEYLATVN